MKAMVLAAGLGTRLKPLTDAKPKALVEINGRPMLDVVLQRLVSAGFNEIIVNVHHFADQIIGHIKNYSFPGIRIEISDETELLLDTGGAIQKARWFLEGNEPFLVHNVDVISDINLDELMDTQKRKQSLATLAVSERKTSRYFLFDDELRLRGWENQSTNEQLLSEGASENLRKLAFSGIHVISPEVFQHIHQEGRFSIVPAYLQLAGSHPIYGFYHDPHTWFDLGKFDNIARAEDFLKGT